MAGDHVAAGLSRLLGTHEEPVVAEGADVAADQPAPVVDLGRVFETLSGDFEEEALLRVRLLEFVLGQREEGGVQPGQFLVQEVTVLDLDAIFSAQTVVEAIYVVTTGRYGASGVSALLQEIPKLVAGADAARQPKAYAADSNLRERPAGAVVPMPGGEGAGMVINGLADAPGGGKAAHRGLQQPVGVRARHGYPGESVSRR